MFHKLRNLRKLHNVEVSQLAKLIGVKTIGAYYKKEAGERGFTLVEAKAIADYFNTSIEDIFFKL
ncbi:helix-turn-helix domain-containing protein [Clostridium sp. 'deep sea']|uniref:helix-turn-helix transcriptional regulator n=1 Tax=Clostridium sp. 'deep sea' TaxID=2779445 RepID=UPI001896864E|nr:helix-turn-helix domain-containing protein [Clostridium sp. 'deep sea']QOR36292.1 helix-turn-helix domain-containing protein [Clostridium sp. 'deep sea']